MKKAAALSLVLLCTAAFAAGYFTTVVRQSPASPRLGKYKTVYIGWLNLPSGRWRKFGYSSKEDWSAVINDINKKSMPSYVSGYLKGIKVKGPVKGFPGGNGLYVKPTFVKFDLGHSYDDMHVKLEFFDTRSRRKVYSAYLKVSSKGVFPRNWKGSTFEGRVDNEAYNLAGFISSKF